MSVLSSNSPGLWIAFSGALLASLAGSGHCAGMCGGLVGLGQRGGAGRGSALLMQGARVATYVGLGGLAGLLGRELLALGILTWLHRLALGVWAAFVVAMAFRIARGEGILPPQLSQAVFRLAARSGKSRPRLLPLGLGVGMAFLPCGWLHGFLMTAALTGSPSIGALTLFGFGLGTLPALAGVSVLARTRLKLPSRVLAGLWLVFGTMSLGLQAGWIAMPGHNHRSGHGHSHSSGQQTDAVLLHPETEPVSLNPANAHGHSHGHAH